MRKRRIFYTNSSTETRIVQGVKVNIPSEVRVWLRDESMPQRWSSNKENHRTVMESGHNFMTVWMSDDEKDMK